MKGKKLLTIATTLNLILFILTIFINSMHEEHIQTMDQHLADKNAEVRELKIDLSTKEDELAENKAQLFWSNKELEMIYMRNEGISYQEDDGK